MLAVSALLSGCLSQNSGAQGQVQLSVKVTADQQTLAEKAGSFPAGTSALDALKQLMPLDYQDTAFGAFVTGVAGRPAGEGNYWALYADGEYAKVGVSLLKLEKDTRLEWRLEKINDAQVTK